MEKLLRMSKDLAWEIHMLSHKEYLNDEQEQILSLLYLKQNGQTIALNRIAEEIEAQEAICF